MISHVVWEPFDGHACTAEDVRQLRRLLELSDEEWPDAVIYRHTDEVAVLIGMALGVARPTTGRAYSSLIRKEMLEPASAFLAALRNADLEREYLQPWTPLRQVDRHQLARQVELYAEAVEGHLSQIVSASRKGKAWDSELKDQFVEYVDMLCEFFDHDFEPARAVDEGHEDNSRFGEVVLLLARPLRWGSSRGSEVPFHGAIRKRVDEWNDGVRQLSDRLRQARGG